MAAFHFRRGSNRKITDVASYVKLLKCITLNCCYDEDRDIYSLRFLTAPYAPQLGVQDCIELMRSCILQKGFVPSSFMRLPAAKDVPSDEVYALMQLCMHERPPASPGVCSDCNEDPKAPQEPALYAAACLALLPTARDLSAQQIAHILQLNMRRDGWPTSKVLSTLLCLPAAQHIDTAAAQGLLTAALEQGVMQGVDILCQHLPACAAAWQQMDPQQLVQHLDAMLHKVGPSQVPKQAEFRALLQHPSLQEHVQQVLPQLLLSAFDSFSKPARDSFERRCADQSAVQNLQALLQLPAAQSLPAAALRQLMQLSILHMGRALLPELVRLPAAAQLQQGDVVVLLQAALGRLCAQDSSSNPDVGAVDGVADGMPSAAPSKQQHGEQHKERGLQNGSQGQQQGLQQMQQQCLQAQGSALGSCSSSSSLPELLRACLQHTTAAPHLFKLLTLPWVQQLQSDALKDLLLAAGERQFKAMFHWLLQQPHAPRDDAEVQGYIDLLRLSAGAPAADPCCWVPKPLPRPAPLQRQVRLEGSESEYESDSPFGDGPFNDSDDAVYDESGEEEEGLGSAENDEGVGSEGVVESEEGEPVSGDEVFYSDDHQM
jgi:hypothetical protein